MEGESEGEGGRSRGKAEAESARESVPDEADEGMLGRENGLKAYVRISKNIKSFVDRYHSILSV